MANLVIELTITPKAPISIAMPVARGGHENRWGNFPVMPVGMDDDGQLVESAFLPASTVRGALRRGAAMSIIGKRGGVTAATAYEMIVGQTADAEKEQEKIDLQAIADEREAKPVVDLFGSGLGIKSRLDIVGHFMPPKPVLPFPITSVRKDLDTTEGALEALTDEERETSILRVELNGRRAAAEGLVEQLERKLNSRRNPLPVEDKPAVEADLKEAKALLKSVNDEIKAKLGEDAMKVSTRAIFQHFALPPNIPLSGTMIVRNYRERDMDLLMAGFDALSRHPVLGAHSARGAGGNIGFKADMRLEGKLLRTVTSGGISEPAKIVDFDES
ncbi:hypothetical protein HKCCSP123_14090 [Rhodobacterales bacterium HKCCSP123]|nr:hypothetical protein [Rhodobacterales bacterium HKCCSP123]